MSEELSYRDWLGKLKRFCAYRDRCSSELRKKLAKCALSTLEKEELLEELRELQYFDNERFAISYARGKFHSNKWGKFKIRRGLRGFEIEDDTIEKALNEIPEEEYRAAIDALLRSKLASLSRRENDAMLLRKKASDYLRSKGFEISMIIDALEKQL